ncbi:MAG: ribosome maturation factor RimP [Myxococcales bacterium]|nr:ribosome maturation factor RimP [Myxococcales bacterium]
MSEREETYRTESPEGLWVREWSSKALRELFALVNPAVEKIGYELIELEYASDSGGPVVRLYVDTIPPSSEEAGVSIEDCSQVSRRVSEVLDEHDPIDGNYRLEVSSPGVFRPLTKLLHLERAVGGRIQVKTTEKLGGRAVFVGTLSAISKGYLHLLVDKQEVEIPLDRIKKANLEPLL